MVMTTLTDRRVWSANPDRWVADAVSGQDYDPFGMVRPNRSVSEDGYRFGFNGKEKDSEFGEVVYDYGFRIYDGRIARFLSVDPLSGSYPWYTPYQFAWNKPIVAIDLDGLEEYSIHMRSFAPWSIFGGGFAGDNRGFSTSDVATSRINYKATANFVNNTLSVNAFCNRSHGVVGYGDGPRITPGSDNPLEAIMPQMNAEATGTVNHTESFAATKTENGSYDGQLNVAAASANPLVPLAPDIDIQGSYKMNYDANNKFLLVNTTITGDEFPAAESFIEDKAGNRIMLATFTAGDEDNFLVNLWGEGKNYMAGSTLKINLDSQGNFKINS